MLVEELLLQRGIPHRKAGEHRHVREGWLGVDCPFCGSVDKFHLGFRDGAWVCWVCGVHRGGDVLAHLLGVSTREAITLARTINADLDAKAPASTKLFASGKLEMPLDVGPLRAAHIKYLKKRRFDPDELSERWGVRGIGHLGGNLAWRIFIPIHYRGDVVSWTTRAIVDGGMRYISASPKQERIRHKQLLFGEEFCGNAVIVHEGPLDAIKTGPGAVALCGIGITSAQVLRLSRYALRYICFDNEPQAQKRAEELSRTLASFPGSTKIVRLDAKDAAEADESELEELRNLVAVRAINA